MDVEELLSAASKNPWAFGALALLAVISAWQPLSRLVLGFLRLLRGLFEIGIIRTFNRYVNSVDVQAKKIINFGDRRNTFLISYTTFSVISGLQSAISFLIGIAILTISNRLPLDSQMQLDFAAYIFLGVGLIAALVWLLDAGFQLLVHLRLRKLLGDDAE